MRVLVIEDYGPIRAAIAEGLCEAEFEVETSENGRDGLWLATSFSFDVVILDLMLPKLDGLTVLKRLREQDSRAFVIILTAKSAVEDRIEGLNLGADDYMVKPFEVGELVARIRAMIRRKYGEQSPRIAVGDLVVDTISKRVWRGDDLIQLTAREYALLEYLAFRAGEVVSRSDIWNHVYDVHDDTTSNVVDVYIGYLRKKIERPGSPRLLHTRRGQGYFLGSTD